MQAQVGSRVAGDASAAAFAICDHLRSSGLGKAMKLPPQRGCDRAGLAVADGAAVDAHHRQHDLARRGDEGLARRIGLLQRESALLDGKPCALMASNTTVRVMPRRMAWSACRVTTVPSLVTIQALAEAPSVTAPSLSTNQASRAPCSIAACRASTLGNSADRLDVDAAPAVIRHADDGDALWRRAPRCAPC